MAIDKRSSKFLRSPTVVPTNTSALLNGMEGKIDENSLNIFKALIKDIDEYKTSMYGITRRFDQMMFLYNSPTGKETDVIEAARMDNRGNFAIGTEYPAWPWCKVDVNGALYAIPQWCHFSHTITEVGVGLYAWDTTLYNPNTDLYQLITGNSRVQINYPGTYQISFGGFATDVVSATGTRVIWNIRLNTVNIGAHDNGLFIDDFCHVSGTKLIRINKGDIVDIVLILPLTADRTGALVRSWLQIVKVN